MMNDNANTANRRFLKPAKLLITLLGTATAFILILEILAVLVLGFSLNSLFFSGAVILLAMVTFIAIFDLFTLSTLKTPEVKRTLPSHLSLNQWGEVSLLLTSASKTPLIIEVYDYPPQQMDFRQLPQSFELNHGQYLLKYPIRPLERGHFYWQTCELTIRSQFGLWQQLRYVPLQSDTRIYPDFTKLYDSHVNTIEQWIYYLGVRPQQRRGLGQDFQQLREFREGDTLRQIDWKATARQNFPIAKEYQDERDQQIIFLLDCGQQMRIKEDSLSHFDHALNASLLLAYVALRQGDAIGLSTFASNKNHYLAPSKGIGQLNTLLNTVYDLQSSQLPADYSEAIQKLISKTRRRSLVIIITNLRSNDDENTIQSFKLLSRYHKVLIASLREEVMDELRTEPVNDLESALTYCGNINHILSRSKLHEKLLAHNLPILDVLPKQFGPQLVNHYLSLKRSGSL